MMKCEKCWVDDSKGKVVALKGRKQYFWHSDPDVCIGNLKDRLAELESQHSAPVDNGIDAMDRTCRDYNEGKIDLTDLAAQLWNVAYAEGLNNAGQQEEPEKVCATCGSSNEQHYLIPIMREEGEAFNHRIEGVCIRALNQDKAELQRENQRLRERLGEGPDKRAQDRCEHCGLPAEHLTVFQCIDDLWEHAREERAKVADELAQCFNSTIRDFINRKAQAIREGRG